jgi:hypothetical protein
MRRQTAFESLPGAVCAQLVALVHERGQAAVSAYIGLSPNTVARAAAGFALQKATAIVVAQGVARLAQHA